MNFEAVNKITGQYLLSPNITRRGIKKLLRIPNLSSIQFGEPVTDLTIWENIESILLTKNPNLEIWIYTNYDESWDFNFLKLIPSVVHFGANGYMNYSNIELIAELKNLESLSLGIYNIKNLEFFNHLNSNLKSLSLGATKSKKHDVSFIGKFNKLEKLSITGLKKGIENLSKLSKLNKLHLSLNAENLKFITSLSQLWSLNLSFSEIKDLTALSELQNLKYLDIFQLRKLDNIDFISEIYTLQYLVLANLPHIHTFPELTNNIDLRRIDLENLKSLTNFNSLECAKNLEEFKFVSCRHIQPKELIPVLKNKSIKDVIAGFGSDKKNTEFDRLKTEYGIKSGKWEEFVFQ